MILFYKQNEKNFNSTESYEGSWHVKRWRVQSETGRYEFSRRNIRIPIKMKDQFIFYHLGREGWEDQPSPPLRLFDILMTPLPPPLTDS